MLWDGQANVSAMIRSEILVSLGHAAWVALVTIACITASRHAITDLFCHTSITLLDYMFVQIIPLTIT